jgi:4-amino-4-deoxy-L-arabinose transferase-like glycosyltransferase
MAGLLALFMVHATLEIFCARRRQAWLVVLAIAGGFGFLVKETTAFVFAACLAALLWTDLRRRGSREQIGSAVGAAVLAAAASYALAAFATGGFGTPLEILQRASGQNSTNAYALGYQSGPGYLLAVGFAKMAPLTFALALAGGWLAVSGRLGSSVPAARPLAWVAFANLAVYMAIPHWLNLRYASASFAPLCLLGGLATASAFDRFAAAATRSGRRPWIPSVGVAALAALVLLLGWDYYRFGRSYVRDGTLDLSIRMVLDARH